MNFHSEMKFLLHVSAGFSLFQNDKDKIGCESPMYGMELSWSIIYFFASLGMCGFGIAVMSKESRDKFLDAVFKVLTFVGSAILFVTVIAAISVVDVVGLLLEVLEI